MCNFFSALVLKNGDVLSHWALDSHTDLVTYFQLPDTTAHHQHFAKVELTPVDWLDAATWKFRLDEQTAPGWWDDVKGQAESTLRARAQAMVIKTGHKQLIVDGCWIIGGDATVRDVRSGWIRRIQDSARVSDVGGSAQVSGVWDSAQVSNVGDSAQVSGVRGSARVSGVWDSAQVSDVGPNVVLDASAKAHLVQP